MQYLREFQEFFYLKEKRNFENCDVVRSITTTRSGINFCITFWIVNQLIMKLGQLTNIVMGKIFRNTLHNLEDYILFNLPIHHN